MNRRKVVFRADGNSNIGLGHIYRLLALSEIVEGEFDCYFAVRNPELFLLNQIQDTCSCLIIENNARQIRPTDQGVTEIEFDLKQFLTGDEIVVTDGYLFGKNYQSMVKATGAKLICIDDLAESEFFADVIINHAPGIDHSIYRCQPYTKIFTGLRYAILRKAFFKPLVTGRQAIPEAFISVGGSDYFGYTLRLVMLLREIDIFKCLNVLCTSSFDDKILSELTTLEKSGSIKVHFNLNSLEIVEILDRCTHAFVSASTVLIESYARGLKCFCGYYTKNQQFIYDGFIQQKLAIGLNHFDLLDLEVIREAIHRQSEIQPLKAQLSSILDIRNLFHSI